MSSEKGSNADAKPVDPAKLYTTAEIAGVLGLHLDTVYRIPTAVLRRTRVGPRKGRTRILGADLLAYMMGRAA